MHAHKLFAQGYYTIESKGMQRKWTQVDGHKTNSIKKERNPDSRAQEQLRANKSTGPYVKVWDINIWMCRVIENWIWTLCAKSQWLNYWVTEAHWFQKRTLEVFKYLIKCNNAGVSPFKYLWANSTYGYVIWYTFVLFRVVKTHWWWSLQTHSRWKKCANASRVGAWIQTPPRRSPDQTHSISRSVAICQFRYLLAFNILQINYTLNYLLITKLKIWLLVNVCVVCSFCTRRRLVGLLRSSATLEILE